MKNRAYNCISIISAKGGVGKTSIAINIACELSVEFSVLLVDCDLYNFGATVWLSEYLEQNAPNDALSLSNIFEAYSEDGINSIRNLLNEHRHKKKAPPEPLKIDLESPLSGRFFFIPAHGRKQLYEDKKFHDFEDWDAEKYANAFDLFLNILLESFKFDIILLDCHPGAIPSTIACCSNSSSNIIVSDYDDSTFEASIFLAWRIESKLRRRDDEYLPPLNWRFAINRVPSAYQLGSSRGKLERAVNAATNIKTSMQSLLPDIEKKGTKYFGEHPILVEIPNIEECALYLDEKILEKQKRKKVGPLSLCRRGGNGFVLSSKSMLSKMAQDNILGSKYQFLNRPEPLKNALENLHLFYFPTRGIGKTGISAWMFYFAFFIT
jgi:cellulose biosynthesis protein BcsQ